MAGLATAQGSRTPVTILVGPGGDDSAASRNITSKVKTESIRIEESGNHESQVADFEILDKALAFASMRGEWKVSIFHGTSPIFRGFIRSPRVEHEGEIYGGVAVTAYDVGSLLDRLIIDVPFNATNDVSDATRIQYLVSTFGQPLVNEGMTDWSKVQTLNAHMPSQKFKPTLTLRQGIERVLSAASDSANYYVDYAVRLHTFDSDNPEAFLAPFDVNATPSPSATEVAPEDLIVEWDATNLINWYYVRGKNVAGSGNFNESNSNMYSLNNLNSFTGTYSIDSFGARKAFIDAPDADTAAKARKVARAALQDTRYPIPRVSFAVSGANCVNSSGQRWQAGQLVYITSPIHGLTGRVTDYLNYRLQPFRIVRLTTTYLAGDGTRRMEIEAGGRRPHLYTPTIGS